MMAGNFKTKKCKKFSNCMILSIFLVVPCVTMLRFQSTPIEICLPDLSVLSNKIYGHVGFNSKMKSKNTLVVRIEFCFRPPFVVFV